MISWGYCWTDSLIALESAERPFAAKSQPGKEKPQRIYPYAREAARPPSGCRLLDLASTASAAESFRSRCGSVRGAPVCSSQASPAALPQVVQGTDSICFGVSSFVFTTTSCNFPIPQECSILTTLNAFSTANPWRLALTPFLSISPNSDQK